MWLYQGGASIDYTCPTCNNSRLLITMVAKISLLSVKIPGDASTLGRTQPGLGVIGPQPVACLASLTAKTARYLSVRL